MHILSKAAARVITPTVKERSLYLVSIERRGMLQAAGQAAAHGDSRAGGSPLPGFFLNGHVDPERTSIRT